MNSRSPFPIPHSTPTVQALGAATLDDLPPEVVLRVLLFVPLVNRVRLCLVSKRWAALLHEPAFWTHVDFEGATAGRRRVSEATVLKICKRSQGNLLSLDLSTSGEHDAPQMPRDVLPCLRPLAKRGLLTKLERLSADKGFFSIDTVRQAERLRAALPALRHAGVTVEGRCEQAAEILAALACRSVGSVRLQPIAAPDVDSDGSSSDAGGDYRARARAAAADDAPTRAFARFATAAASALSLCRVSALEFSPPCDHGAKIATPADRAAAADLAAALTDPIRGPTAIRGSGWTHQEADTNLCSVPALAQLCAALTPRSPLRELSVTGGLGWKLSADTDTDTDTGGATQHGGAAALLAGALQPGRSRLTSLSLEDVGLVTSGCAHYPHPSPPRCGYPPTTRTRPTVLLLCLSPSFAPPLHFTSRRGGLALFASLATNATLTSLSLTHCDMGGAELAALAVALRRNRTLTSLELHPDLHPHSWEREECERGAIRDAAAALFRALGGGGENEGSSAVSALSLDIGATTDPAAFFTRAAAEALGGSLRRGAPLRRLLLSASPWRPEPLPAQAQATAAAAVPRYSPGDAFAAVVCGALRLHGGASPLREVALSGVEIGDAGARVRTSTLLFPAFQRLGSPPIARNTQEIYSAIYMNDRMSMSSAAGRGEGVCGRARGAVVSARAAGPVQIWVRGLYQRDRGCVEFCFCAVSCCVSRCAGGKRR